MSLRGAYVESTFPYIFERSLKQGEAHINRLRGARETPKSTFFPRGYYGTPCPYNIYTYMYIYMYIYMYLDTNILY